MDFIVVILAAAFGGEMKWGVRFRKEGFRHRMVVVMVAEAMAAEPRGVAEAGADVMVL